MSAHDGSMDADSMRFFRRVPYGLGVGIAERNTQSMLELLEVQLSVDDLTSQAAAFRQHFSAEMERAEHEQSSLQNELAAVAFERDSALQNEASETQRACALQAAADATAEAHHCQLGALLADQAAAAEASLRAQGERRKPRGTIVWARCCGDGIGHACRALFERYRLVHTSHTTSWLTSMCPG